MTAAMRRGSRPPIVASDIRQIGGIVTVQPGRDRVDGSPTYQITHTSRGGDCRWQSSFTPSLEHAEGGAHFLAEFLGGRWSK